jgi:hypothetical protein
MVGGGGGDDTVYVRSSLHIPIRVARFFTDQIYQNGKNISKYHKLHQTTKTIYQMAVNYTKWPKNIPTFSIPRPSKLYPNWDFWSKNKPSGNPDTHTKKEKSI